MIQTEKPEPILTLEQVRFSFATGDGELFRGIDLTLGRGESFTVIGPGGEGKTTLLKMMAGLIRPGSGSVRFEGQPTDCLSRETRMAIGMTFQKSGLFDSLSCLDNLVFPLRELLRLGRKEARMKAESALEEVGLKGQGGLLVPEMSGGMQKRLGVARALVLSPRLVLYDDPTAGLDPVTSRAIVELIREMKARHGMTLVIVVSDPALGFSIAERGGFLYQGRLEVASTEALGASRNPAIHQFVSGLLDGPLTQAGGVA